MESDDSRESAVETIGEMWAEMLDNVDDEDDQPDDLLLQLVQGATEVCNAHGIKQGARVDVIADGMKQGWHHQTDAWVKDVRFRLEVMSDL